MTTEMIEKHFQIKVQSSYIEGSLVRYLDEQYIYTFVPVTDVPEALLIEYYQMSQHLMQHNDHYASVFVPTKENKFLVSENEMDYVLLANKQKRPSGKKKLGRKLAKFHYRGMHLPEQMTQTSRIGEWKAYWEKRLEQIEGAYMSIVQAQPSNDFERTFVEAFPYYSGLCENAIQYLVDTDIDATPTEVDGGTICHERFFEGKWGRERWIHFPFDWVYDHPARDIAEWIRDQYFNHKHTFKQNVQQFIQNYESVTKLSPYGWRKVYARLLFPLHFFECVESYFVSRSERQQLLLEEQLTAYLRQSKAYEQFLMEFQRLASHHANSSLIPALDWLS